jgi:hypothetical protein
MVPVILSVLLAIAVAAIALLLEWKRRQTAGGDGKNQLRPHFPHFGRVRRRT